MHNRAQPHAQTIDCTPQAGPSAVHGTIFTSFHDTWLPTVAWSRVLQA